MKKVENYCSEYLIIPFDSLMSLSRHITPKVVTRGARGNIYPGAEYLWGRRMTADRGEKPQHCHKYFLQYSTFASERPQVRT